MAYWLFKSEPGTWGWDDQVKKNAPEQWDGVRNYQARNFMREMRVGELGFFYHSVNEKKIVGIIRIAAACHPDTTTDDERWECVDVEAVKSLVVPVSLEQIKQEAELADMILVKNSRLSVQPVSKEQWDHICQMGQIDAY